MLIRVIAVGTRMPSWVQAPVDDYSSRLPSDWRIEWKEIRAEQRGAGANAAVWMAREAQRIRAAIPPAATVIALDEKGMDRVYDLPYTRKPHPRYKEPIPAHTMIKDSVTTMRGCFGGCTFCSITMHQGRAIQSRSQKSILKEVRQMAADPAGPVNICGRSDR